MLTIFTSFKPFTGAAADIQMRSLENWRAEFPDANIVNFETAADGSLPSDLRTVVIDEGKGKVPLFGSMVRWMEANTGADLFLYANGDILFPSDLSVRLASLPNRPFLLTGQRVDIGSDGSKRLHGPSGMDYFIFCRGIFDDLPDVVMGRAYCDSALVAHCLRKKISVIDGSFAIRVEHQFHDYGHVDGGRETVWTGNAAMRNLEANRLRGFAPHCIDASHALLRDGRIVPNVRASLLRKLELEMFYRKGCRWCPPFNAWWNLLTRGGKLWKNPKW
jgi:hypothetical protein